MLTLPLRTTEILSRLSLLEMVGHFFTKELLILIPPSPSELLNCEKSLSKFIKYNEGVGQFLNQRTPSFNEKQC